MNCGIGFRYNNSGLILRQRTKTIDAGGDTYESTVDYSGIYIDFNIMNERRVKDINGNYHKINAEAVISNNSITGVIIDPHDFYVVHPIYGTFKVVNVNNMPYFPYMIQFVELMGDSVV